MVDARLTFPPGFMWGTATSAHQVEGDNQLNDWYLWEQRAGSILEAGRSADACQWWQGRWREDLERAAAAHQNTHRLSIEWSRIEPEPGRWDDEALAYYREIIGGMVDLGLTPVVTLHHFTNPAWLHQKGGWLDDSVIERFTKFAAYVTRALADQVGFWVTFNEPNVYAYAAYAAGAFPPGETSITTAIQVLVRMAEAHAAAYEAIHQIQPHALVGIAHHYRSMRPLRPYHPIDRLIAGMRSRLFNHSLAEALETGRFRLPGRTLRLPELAGTQDYIGLNYYTRERVAFDIRRPGEMFGRASYSDRVEVSPNGFIANEPDGFWEALAWAAKFRLPLYVMENGVEDGEDGFRRRYLLKHLQKLWLAANFNWRVMGYFHWSLVDNFEWERGWTQSFGLWQLDQETQARHKRPSADLYKEICANSAISADMVRRFAPEIEAEILPHAPSGELG